MTLYLLLESQTGAHLLVVDDGNFYVSSLHGMTALVPKEVLRKSGMIYDETRANAG